MNARKKPYKPAPEFSRQHMKMQRAVAQAVTQFKLITSNDRILVAMSGGKDSYALLHFLVDFQRRSPTPFELFPVTVSTGFGDFLQNTAKIADFVYRNYDLKLTIIEEQFEEIITKHKTEGTSSCSFCARLRRGTLQTYAAKHGINKIALGHHADDIIESFLMSQLQNGRLWTQAPIYATNKGIQVIRPLFFVFERQIIEFRDHINLPTISCNCEYEGDPQHFRAVSKRLLYNLEAISPDCKNSLLRCCVECVQSVMRRDGGEEQKADQM